METASGWEEATVRVARGRRFASGIVVSPHGRTARIPTFTVWQRTALMLLALLTTAACAAGSIRDGAYRDPHDRFTLRLPPARWQLASLDGAALAFRAPDLDAGMGLRVDCDSPEPGPLPWVARHLFFGLSNKRIDASERLTRSDASGVRTRLRARLDDRPVEVDAVTMRRESCLYDFVYVAPPERFEEGQPDFDAFVRSWSPLPRP
jgi:hypothetical protein